MLATLALLAVLPAAGTLHGTVRSHPSGEPVPYATVEVENTGRRARTDEHGYYALAGLPSGRQRVHVRVIGHDPWTGEVTIPEGGAARLDVSLPSRAIALGALDAVASATRREDVAGPPGVLLDAATVRSLPALVEPDVFRAVQSLPSVAAASDYSTAIYMRGGSPDQTLVTLDGTPLFNPFHLAGLFSAVDPDAVASLDVWPGALPAEMGDRMSGAVAIHTREGGRDRMRSSGGVGLVSSRASVDGPLPGGRGTFLVSARRTYLDVATGAARKLGLIPVSLPYSFTDGHVKLTFPVGASGQLTAAGYLNDEGFEIPDDWDVGDAGWTWGSRAASLRYRGTLGANLLLEGGAAVSAFRGELDRPPTGESGPRRDERLATTTMRDLLADVRLTRYGASHRTTVGAQADAYLLSHDVRTRDDGDLATFLPPLRRTDRPRTLALYVSDEWTATERLRLRGGLRVLAHGDGAVWMPRLGARWALSDRLALTAGGGRYAQVVHTLRDEESVVASLFAYDLLVGGAPQVSDDAVLGMEWSAGTTQVRVDAFAKRFRGLDLAPLAPNPAESPALVAEGFREGRGWARGVEVLARHRQGPVNLSLGYALSFGAREVDSVRFAPRYTRRHALDLSAVAPLGPKGQASVRLAWQSGQPYTPVESVHQPYEYDPATGGWTPGPAVVVYGGHNSETLPAYLRLDVGLRRTWERRWFGAQCSITPSLQVLNVLGSKNVVWATPEPEGTGARLQYGPQLPVFPTVGLEWRC